MTTWFESPDDATARLLAAGYLTDDATALTAYLAGALEKPLLVEGPAGVGKTELAKAVARATGAELVRLQCYEGLDEATVARTLGVVLKHASDQQRAIKELKLAVG